MTPLANHIVSLLQDGYSATETAQIAGCDPSYVWELAKKFGVGNVAHYKHYGRGPAYRTSEYSAQQRADDDALLACPDTAPHKAWFKRKTDVTTLLFGGSNDD